MDSVKLMTVRSGEVDLQVRIEGNPQGPTLVMVHGYPDDLHVWDSVVPLLEDSFRIIRYDVRGAGESSAPKGKLSYTMDKLSEDLRAVILATKNDRPVHLIAHDWGSIQTWASVTDPLLSPIFASFTSVSGPCLDYMGAKNREVLRSKDLRQWKGFLQQMAKSWYVAAFQLPFLPEQAWTEARAKKTEAAIAKREGIPPEYFSDPLRAKNGTNGIQLYRANMIPRLTRPKPRKTDLPILVIIPTSDGYVGEAIARSCEDFASKVQFEKVDGGHWFFIREPGLLTRHIRSFVNGIERVSA